MDLQENHFKAVESILFDSAIIKRPHVVFQKYLVKNDVIIAEGEEKDRPQNFSGAFVSFAKAAGVPTANSLLKWVNRWGLPGESHYKEELSFLLKEAKEARRLLSLYEAAAKGRQDEIIERMELKPFTGFSLSEDIKRSYYLFFDGKPTIGIKVYEGLDPRYYALFHISEGVCSRLKDSVYLDSSGLYDATAQAEKHHAGGLVITPAFACKNPLDYIWLEFYILMAQKKTLKVCLYCGTPFPPQRSTKVFCSIYCQQAAWKAKKRNEEKEAKA